MVQEVDPTTVVVNIQPDDAYVTLEELFGHLDRGLGLSQEEQGDGEVLQPVSP